MTFSVLVQTLEEAPSRTGFLPVEPMRTGEPLRCDVCGGTLGLLPWRPPCYAELEFTGNCFEDIAFGPADELLISESLKTLYKEGGFVGLSGFYKVHVTRLKGLKGKRHSCIPPYYAVQIAHSHATIDDRASGAVREPKHPCPRCHASRLLKRIRQVKLVQGSWSGEDIFIARGLPGVILVSPRLAARLRRADMRGVHLVDAAAFGFDLYPWER